MEYCFEEVNNDTFDKWLEMGLKLWPDHTEDELRTIFRNSFVLEVETAYICRTEYKALGFINLSIRSDYVEGAETSPVGYVEGLYVRPEFRNQNVARLLLKEGEKWAVRRGCKQMASDCELHNAKSYKFHQRVGFKEVNRLICFIKDLGS